MKKHLIEDYSTINPHERFRLAVKALARSDTVCLKQLVNSCRTGRSQFVKQLEAARQCTVALVPSICEKLGRWETFSAMMRMGVPGDQIDFFYDRYRHSTGLSEDVGRIVERLLELMAEPASETGGRDASNLAEWQERCGDFVSDCLLKAACDAEGPYVSCVYEMPGDALMDKIACMLVCHILEQARAGLATWLGLIWLAFGSVCRSQMHLEPETLLEAFVPPGAVSFVEDFRFEMEVLGENLDIDQELESSMRDLWLSITS